MFLDHIAQAGLLQHDPESNVLKDFSLNVRKVLVSQVVGFLLDPSTPQSILSSRAHLKWVMETCGQGFALPIEEESTIAQCIELYRRWALEPEKRPSALDEHPQYYIQTILQNYSLLFATRSNQALVGNHAALCAKILDIYLAIARQLGRSLSLETWEVFLKIVFGIGDSLLTPVQGAEDSLAKRITQQLLKVIFELLLHSRTRNPALWGSLKKFVAGWTHLSTLITQWNITTLALTTRSLAILYGASEGTEAVVLKLDDTQTLNIEDDFVFYAWHRVLNILGNLNKIPTAQNFFAAFCGVEVLVQQYLRIGNSDASKKRVLPPDGNTILHIFGQWLFEALQLDRPGFDEGTALAIKILCNILCTRNTSKFLPVYLGSFYSSMAEILQKEGRVLISAIMNCQSFFDYEIEGSRVLVPYFIYAIGRIITKKVPNFEHIQRGEAVRKACMKILGTLFCLPNHFNQAVFKLKGREGVKKIATESGTPLEAEVYSQLKPHISTILLASLQNETHAPNIQMILHMIFTYQCEDIAQNAEFSKQAIYAIIAKTCSHNWPIDVQLSALRVLSMMTSIYSRIEAANDHAKHIVSSLCRYAMQQIDAGWTMDEKDGKENESLVAEIFYTISNWVVVDTQWILQDRKTLVLTLEAVVAGLTPQKQEISEVSKTKATATSSSRDKKGATPEWKSTTTKKIVVKQFEKIKEAADYLLQNLMNGLGNFPTSCGTSRTSTLVTEEDLLIDLFLKGGDEIGGTPADTKQFIRYFTVDNAIIVAVIDRPYEEGGPATTIIVRDKTGKYAWDTKLAHLPLADQGKGPAIPFDENDRSVHSEPFINAAAELDASQLTDIYSFLDKRKNTPVVNLTTKEVENEKKYLETHKFSLNVDIASSPPMPANIYSGSAKLQQSRLFLTHTGFLSLENKSRVCLVDQNVNFFKNLQFLDSYYERECQKIGVLFIAKGQTSETDWLNNLGGSIDYQEFINSLGWGINVSTHNGFLGGLDKKANGDVAPYYATYNTEVIFHVATLMPNIVDDANGKAKKINSDHVVIVWCEELDNYKPNFKSNMFQNVHIVIHPLECGLYRIRIYQRHENLSFGPLTDDAVVSKNILGVVVRETAIQAYRAVRAATEGPFSQILTRKKFIEDIIAKYKKETTLEQFYSAIFTAVGQNMLGPIQATSAGELRPRARREREESGPGFSRSTPSSRPGQSLLGNSRSARQIEGSPQGSPSPPTR